MGPREVLDKVAAGTVEHKDLARLADGTVRPHDADHFGLPLVMSHMIEERLFTGREGRLSQAGRSGSRSGGSGDSSIRGSGGHGKIVRSHRRNRSSSGCRGQRVSAIAAVERHVGHLGRHRGNVGRAPGTREILEAAARIDIAIDKGELCLFKLLMDGREGGEQPLVVCGVGGVTDADQRAVDRKQAAAATTLHRLAGHLHIGGSEVFVDRGDPAVVKRRVGTAVAAHGHHWLTRLGLTFG